MKVVLNVFTGELLLIPVTAAGAPPTITTSIDTEGGDHLITESGDLLIPES
jgi:hypothetical protein